MKRLTGIQLVEQIVARLTKGYAFRPGTAEEKQAYYAGVRRSVENDYATMQYEAFEQKYADQIDGAKKKPVPMANKAVKVSQGSPRKPAKRLSPEKQEEADAKKLQETRERIARMLKNNPPNRSFYCYTNMTDSEWHRLNALPSEEELNSRKAIVWTAGMMAAFDPRIVLKAMHFAGRVIEFEYQYRGEGDELKSYNPHF
ncbi:MAG: hypothetical protein ABWX90_00880 [Candidatus Saccharimonadales bacterium]